MGVNSLMQMEKQKKKKKKTHVCAVEYANKKKCQGGLLVVVHSTVNANEECVFLYMQKNVQLWKNSIEKNKEKEKRLFSLYMRYEYMLSLQCYNDGYMNLGGNGIRNNLLCYNIYDW